MVEYVDNDPAGGERITSVTFLDGFGRRFRQGWFADGTRKLSFDFNGDGLVDQTDAFAQDEEWFKKQPPYDDQMLLRDYRLTAQGDIQGRSVTYLNSEAPEAYQTFLKDSLARTTFTEDFGGFGTFVRYDTSSTGLGTQLWRNDLDQYPLRSGTRSAGWFARSVRVLKPTHTSTTHGTTRCGAPTRVDLPRSERSTDGGKRPRFAVR